MKQVTMYQAADGELFQNEEECLRHECLCVDARTATDMLATGSTLLEALKRANSSRPWWDNGIGIADKLLLDAIKGDTGIVVEHWQCSTKPGYKPCAINDAGHVRLWGDAGCWSGPYGGWLSVREVLNYAKKTPGLVELAQTVSDEDF